MFGLTSVLSKLGVAQEELDTGGRASGDMMVEDSCENSKSSSVRVWTGVGEEDEEDEDEDEDF